MEIIEVYLSHFTHFYCVFIMTRDHADLSRGYHVTHALPIIYANSVPRDLKVGISPALVRFVISTQQIPCTFLRLPLRYLFLIVDLTTRLQFAPLALLTYVVSHITADSLVGLFSVNTCWVSYLLCVIYQRSNDFKSKSRKEL